MEPLVSLIVATVGRREELEQFLSAVTRQTYRHVEVIVVDQNADDRLDAVVARHRKEMLVVHVRCSKGASKARNVGMRNSRGELIAFPDDDCWYAPSLLSAIVSKFRAHPEWDGLTGRIVNDTGAPSGDARFDSEAGYLTLANVWRRACAATLFLTRETVAAVGYFDEELGPGAGTPWGGAEDIDYTARMIRAGRSIFYDPAIRVFHPDSPTETSTVGVARAYTYGAGIGRVWMKHRFPYSVIVYYLVRPLAGALLSVTMGRWSEARYRWAAFQGRLSGLRSR